jgi:hypothetical protein
MSESNIDKAKSEESYIEELLRQISAQSAIIAGFSFTGLILEPNSVDSKASLCFTIFVAISMGLHTLALSTSGVLLAAFKYKSEMNSKWKTHFNLCWGCYLLGLVSFLISLPFIIYVRFPILLIPGILFTLIVLYNASMQFQAIFKKTKSEE